MAKKQENEFEKWMEGKLSLPYSGYNRRLKMTAKVVKDGIEIASAKKAFGTVRVTDEKQLRAFYDNVKREAAK